MPKIKPLSEFNRNQTAVLDELERTGEPIYLTRNGEAAAVIISPEAFDREVSFKGRVLSDEMRVCDSLLKGYADYKEGRVEDAETVEARWLDKFEGEQ